MLTIVFLAAIAFFFYQIGKKIPKTEYAKSPLLKSYSEFIQLDGMRIHYWQQGNGPNLILLHGIGASNFIWRQVFPRLQKSFTVTAVEYAGFGLSSKLPNISYGLDDQADRLHKILKKLKVNDGLIVASSMGAAISMWMCTKFKTKFSGFVVLAPAVTPKSINKMAIFAPFFLPKLHKKNSQANSRSREKIEKGVAKVILKTIISDSSKIDAEAINGYMDPYLGPENAFIPFVKSIELLKDPRLPEHLKDFMIPTRIIWGTKDRAVPLKSVKLLERLLPSSTLSIYEGAGHHLMEDRPTQLCTDILTFAKELKFEIS